MGAAAGAELIDRGLAPAPGPGCEPRPGPFALGSPERVSELLNDAGFLDVEVEAVDLTRRQTSFTELWETTLDLSPSFHDAVLSRPAAEIAEIETALAERFACYTRADGTLKIPARTLVASASA